ncbi:MAG: helix-turn-helix domain-containing protein [Anaerolineae bacterium]|jgi:transposase|uniref:helix-turn-helix domain-containing protein n=1 Tax=Thermogutta sp. TaxID=1962930 RepID=UPI0032204CDA
MGQRGSPTTLEERVEIAERAQAGETDLAIAAAIGRSVWTVRKWRRRHQQQGQDGLVSSMGRPPSGALGSFPPEVRDALRRLREEHPGWGPETLRLEWEPHLSNPASLPSRSRIAAFLRQEGLTRPYERRQSLPQPEAGRPQHPHEVWEVDALRVTR